METPVKSWLKFFEIGRHRWRMMASDSNSLTLAITRQHVRFLSHLNDDAISTTEFLDWDITFYTQ